MRSRGLQHMKSERATPTLTLSELENIRMKERALDSAIEWLRGRCDSEKLMTVYKILTERK